MAKGKGKATVEEQDSSLNQNLTAKVN